MIIKQKQINSDVLRHLKSNKYDDFVAKIVAARVAKTDDLDLILNGTIKNLSSPFLFKDIKKAVDRIYIAIDNNEIIGIETDHDCDGQTSHAIFYEALTKVFNHPKDKIRSYIGHRMKEGYGLSDSLAKRILDDSILPSLIITADNGSTDETRIYMLKQNGIDTIVTDHHSVPLEGAPKSAIAVLNPNQLNCHYPDKSIAGCMVAWLFMAALRRKFIENSKKLGDSYSLSDLLDLVAVGTVADCVSMANSHNNRIVTKLGIEKLRHNNRKCWNFFDKDKISSEYIGFSIAPILNSDGRLADALGSVSFLLENDEKKADNIFNNLKEQNNQRKDIQKQLTEQAITKARELNKKSICILLDNGHAGIHGISASRIKDMFGKPTIIFSQTQTDPNLIAGSARSIDEIHIKQVLDIIAAQKPDLMKKYGGHRGAAGLTIEKQDFEDFYNIFEQLISEIVTRNNLDLSPKIEYDFELDESEFNFATLVKIDSLEPYGREFEKPLFCNDFVVDSIRFVGKDKNHAQMILKFNNISIKGIWFNAIDDKIASEIKTGSTIKACYQLQKEEFLGQINLSLNIKAVQI